MAAFVQLSFLSPVFWDVHRPLQVNLNKRQALLIVIGFNLFRMVLHLVQDLPEPHVGEFLHGGVTIEFIGVKALESKVPFVVWDLFVLMLQLVAFSIVFPSPEETGTDDRVSAQIEGSDIPDGRQRLLENDGYIYSGQLVVQNVRIWPALVENWVHGLPVPDPRTVSPNDSQTPSVREPQQPAIGV